MNIDILFALLMFAFVSTITPGPNNLMLLASGANFGFQRTLPHMLGIMSGVVVMIVLLGLGAMQVFERVAWSYDLLKILCVLYMLYLASKIARSAPLSESDQTDSKPFSFVQAALFQWVNPKAWTMALTAITLYSPERSVESVLIIALVFGVVNLPSISVWVLAGKQLQVCLADARYLRYFNWTMAAFLLVSLYPMLSL